MNHYGTLAVNQSALPMQNNLHTNLPVISVHALVLAAASFHSQWGCSQVSLQVFQLHEYHSSFLPIMSSPKSLIFQAFL